jgi:hypothetical protein
MRSPKFWRGTLRSCIRWVTLPLMKTSTVMLRTMMARWKNLPTGIFGISQYVFQASASSTASKSQRVGKVVSLRFGLKKPAGRSVGTAYIYIRGTRTLKSRKFEKSGVF